MLHAHLPLRLGSGQARESATVRIENVDPGAIMVPETLGVSSDAVSDTLRFNGYDCRCHKPHEFRLRGSGGGFSRLQQAPDRLPSRNLSSVSSSTPRSSASGGPSVLQRSPSRQISASRSSSWSPSSVGTCTQASCPLGW